MSHIPTPKSLGSHVWVELIAFDTTQPEFGVAAYLDDLIETPATISLLLYSAAFLHDHVADQPDRLLPIECTSYGARPAAARGPRQDWTQRQLRHLVGLLRQRDIAVVFAVFDLHSRPGPHGPIPGDFAVHYPELTPFNRQAEARDGLINPLAHLADGTPYAELFANDLARVLRYYQFSGFHLADGLSSTRLSLWDGDFSVGFCQMFAHQHTRLLDPQTLTDNTPQQVKARATALWEHHRSEWIEFHVDQFTRLWTAISSVVHEAGGVLIANNAWTRDPFEALYRYGCDYDRMRDSGIDIVVMESSAAAIELLEHDEPGPVLPWIMAATTLARPHLHPLPMYALIGVHDWYEGWDVIGDARPLLQRDIWAITSPRTADTDGLATRCISGVLWCLGDSLTSEQWRWLHQQRQAAGLTSFQEEPATTLIYHPASNRAGLSGFTVNRWATPGRVLEQLTSRGAAVTRIAHPVEQLPAATPIVVLRADLHPSLDLERYPHRAVLTLNDDHWTLDLTAPEHSSTLQEPADPINGDGERDITKFTQTLPMSEPPAALLDQLARWIQRHDAPHLSRTRTVTPIPPTSATAADALLLDSHSFTRLRAKAGTETLIVNNTDRYLSVDRGSRLEIEALSSGTVIRPRHGWAGQRSVQLPPRGVAAIRETTRNLSTAKKAEKP